MQKTTTNKRETPESIGPCCAYDASTPYSPTGFTWRRLQEYRDGLARQSLLKHGITDPTDEMLCAKPVPTYEQYFNIKPKVEKVLL